MGRVSEGVLRRQRAVTILGLALLFILAWAWIVTGAGMDMAAQVEFTFFPHRSPGMAMEMTWDSPRFLLNLAMWWVMMVAMMVPAAAPTVLLYSRSAPQPHTGAFLAGYLISWLAFSLVAVLLQVALEKSGLLTSMGMTVSNRWIAGGLLVVAGLYQFSPLKDSCLSHCRSPAHWLSTHFKPGALGALRMGLSHGTYCVGCCWMLMALLFVGGVMNLAWIAALTLIVAAEKLLPGGKRLAYAGGLLLLAWGGAILALG